MSFISKTISQLVSDNQYIASALHFLGIHFDKYTDKTLEEICRARGWNITLIENRIEEILKSNLAEINLNSLPIDLLIEYLKHNHYIFIKQRLPFLTDTINNFEDDSCEIKNELKIVFPLFVNDFIEHIYEEEDTLFTYVLQLNKAQKDPKALAEIHTKMQKFSIKHFQKDHHLHDDQLKGLRRMTHNFEIEDSQPLPLKIVLAELSKLDREMLWHAKIENDILFPKALDLERKVLGLAASKIPLN
jgi:regulator of cell morphogenesis and NO signaling